MTGSALTDVRLSAQRALWGAVPTSLRAFSVEVVGNIIRTRSIFDGTETTSHRELLAVATAEIIADFSSAFTIENECLSLPIGTLMPHLQHVIFQRYEP